MCTGQIYETIIWSLHLLYRLDLVHLRSLMKRLIQLIINARIGKRGGIKMQTSMLLVQCCEDCKRASKSMKQQSAGVRCTEATGSAELT